MLPGLTDFLGILVDNNVALLLLDADEGQLAKVVLTDRHLCRKADAIGMPPTI